MTFDLWPMTHDSWQLLFCNCVVRIAWIRTRMHKNWNGCPNMPEILSYSLILWLWFMLVFPAWSSQLYVISFMFFDANNVLLYVYEMLMFIYLFIHIIFCLDLIHVHLQMFQVFTAYIVNMMNHYEYDAYCISFISFDAGLLQSWKSCSTWCTWECCHNSLNISSWLIDIDF